MTANQFLNYNVNVHIFKIHKKKINMQFKISSQMWLICLTEQVGHSHWPLENSSLIFAIFEWRHPIFSQCKNGKSLCQRRSESALNQSNVNYYYSILISVIFGGPFILFPIKNCILLRNGSKPFSMQIFGLV